MNARTHYHDTPDAADTEWNTRTAPQVKPLVWKDYGAFSLSLCGLYRIYLLDDGVQGRKTFRLIHASFGTQYIGDFRDNCEPEKARTRAKASAQADHESRILSALER